MFGRTDHQARPRIQRAHGKGAFEVHPFVVGHQQYRSAAVDAGPFQNAGLSAVGNDELLQNLGQFGDFPMRRFGQIDGGHRDAERFQSGGAVLAETSQAADQHPIEVACLGFRRIVGWFHGHAPVFDARTVDLARAYSGSVANGIEGRKNPAPLSVPGNLAPSVLEAFFKLQQNLHHFIAFVSYLDLELAMTGSLAVYRKTERKGG